jgi:predicted nuclease of restriction endonuclease-like (RecB) superfamily
VTRALGRVQRDWEQSHDLRKLQRALLDLMRRLAGQEWPPRGLDRAGFACDEKVMNSMARGGSKDVSRPATTLAPGYDALVGEIATILETARRAAARSVNAVMTATYWEIGRRIIQAEQGGARRAGYGEALLERLSTDLARRFGRGFSVDNLETMRRFWLAYPEALSSETPSRDSAGAGNSETVSRNSRPPELAARFPLSWSHYVHLVRHTRSAEARGFYEAEALRNGWSVRQLERQIDSQFYERTLLSRNKAALLRSGQERRPEDEVTPEEEIRDPFVLEFLTLKDEYSESDLEEALVRKLEAFLLELGGDFAFVGRQRRLRVGDEWYRVDLLFFHRRLRCLVVIDLKLGKFTHADAGQMHLYLNYAREHWTQAGENPPVGIILCTRRDAAVVRYALEGLPNKVLAAEYRTTLPDADQLADELTRTRQQLERARTGRR